MLNKLTGCSIISHIADLPSIINDNNDKVKNEFGIIYDSSLNRLNKSIYSPTGYVNSYFGDFDNLQSEYVTIKNVESFKSSIYNETIKILSKLLVPHNKMDDRWSGAEIEDEYKDTDYRHDASTIVYSYKTTYKRMVANTEYITVYDKICDISAGNLNFSNNSSTYTSKDVAETIEWKNDLLVAPITLTDVNGNRILCNAVCESIVQPTNTEAVNDMMNRILGSTNDVAEETDKQIEDLLPIATDIYEGDHSQN